MTCRGMMQGWLVAWGERAVAVTACVADYDKI
jgi:hypothetical protein